MAIVIILLAINIIAFIAYGIDKLKAKKGQWRIPESTLLLLAVLGGSIGAWMGTRIWRHKTMHKKFKYGIPLIFIMQAALLMYILSTTGMKLEIKEIFRQIQNSL